MEEVLHHLVPIGNYKTPQLIGLEWVKPSTKWCRISSIHSMFDTGWVPHEWFMSSLCCEPWLDSRKLGNNTVLHDIVAYRRICTCLYVYVYFTYYDMYTIDVYDMYVYIYSFMWYVYMYIYIYGSVPLRSTPPQWYGPPPDLRRPQDYTPFATFGSSQTSIACYLLHLGEAKPSLHAICSIWKLSGFNCVLFAAFGRSQPYVYVYIYMYR